MTGEPRSTPGSTSGSTSWSSPVVKGTLLGPRSRTLFVGARVKITDVSCLSDEPCALGDVDDGERLRLIFTRVGVAMAYSPSAYGSMLVTEPAQILLLGANEAPSFRHPAGPHAHTTFSFIRDNVFAAEAFARATKSWPPVGITPWHGVVSSDLLLRVHALRCTLLDRPMLDDTIASIEDEAQKISRQALDLVGWHGRSEGHHMLTRARRTDPQRHDMIQRAKKILASAPGEAHAVDDIATALGASASHLAHSFSQEAGLSLHQYLLRIRMAIALDRISGGWTDLSRLAVDLGFATHSHFSATFRHSFGLSPRDARRLLRRHPALESCRGRERMLTPLGARIDHC
jgi:AraC-like DNA-binding protein